MPRPTLLPVPQPRDGLHIFRELCKVANQLEGLREHLPTPHRRILTRILGRLDGAIDAYVDSREEQGGGHRAGS